MSNSEVNIRRVRLTDHILTNVQRTLCGLTMRLLACLIGLAAGGCDAFNPAFVDLLDPTGSGQFATLNNAPGHVVIAFVNNADVDEQLLGYLEGPANLVLTGAEKRELRPRMRLRVQVTFTDGTVQTIEFIDGSRSLVEPAFAAEVEPDLNQNDLTNAVVPCDVASVVIAPGTDIEVFIPAALQRWTEETVRDATGNEVTSYRFQGEERPEFRRLDIDELDADGNVTVRRNIGRRDAPSPVAPITCGSVIAIVAEGVLKLPFLTQASSRPSYSSADNVTIARIGGRYEFRTTVQ